MKLLLLLFLVCTLSAGVTAQWVKQTVNTTASFRGLSVVSEKIVWASGTGGTVIKTTDAGKTWKVMTVPGADKLDFRDIEAFDSKTAYVLSIGNGESSRIYKTTDGGETWTEQFHNKDEKAFYDAIACWDRKNCIAMSDPVGGYFVVLSTSDAGATWKQIVSNSLPGAKSGEAAFAASGTCLYISPKGIAYLVSGGNDARVFRSTDRGETWIVANTPILRGTAGSGIFSIAMHNTLDGIIVGGNYEKPNEAKDVLAYTSDGGETWKLGAGLTGFRSAVAIVDKKTIVTVGTNGTDLTTDGGKTWKKVGSEDLNAVAARGKDAVWAVGPKGRVARLDPIVAEKPTSHVGGPHPINVYAVSLSRDQVSLRCSTAACQIVDVAVTAPDVSEIEHFYKASAGRVVGVGPNVKWDLTGVRPGRYTITAGVDDGGPWGRIGMTRTAIVTVIE